MIESRASAVKTSTSVLPFMKVTLTRSSSTEKSKFITLNCRMFLQNLSGEVRMKVYGVICHRKMANFLNQCNKNIFCTGRISGPTMRSTTVVALGCSKSRGPSTNGNCSGFCNLSDDIFSLHLKKDVGMVNNDVIEFDGK